MVFPFFFFPVLSSFLPPPSFLFRSLLLLKRWLLYNKVDGVSCGRFEGWNRSFWCLDASVAPPFNGAPTFLEVAVNTTNT